MALVYGDYRRSLCYSLAYNGDSSIKKVSGLNFANSGFPNSGPSTAVGLEAIVRTLESFTQGSLADFSVIQERFFTLK